MGQTASKGLSKAAEKVSKRAMDQRPPIPSRGQAPPPPPPPHLSSTLSSSSSSDGGDGPTASNPAMFLRGEGIAKQDVRDVGQEMYLQHVQQQRQNQNKNKNQQHHQQQRPTETDDEKDNLSKKSQGSLEDTNQNQNNDENFTNNTSFLSVDQQYQSNEMPADLLKFIQDVGPAKKSVDKDLTAPRLLQDEHKDELAKGESSRKASRRRRVQMPLVSGLVGTDAAATVAGAAATDNKNKNNESSAALVTEKNTNFAGFPLDDEDMDMDTAATSTEMAIDDKDKDLMLNLDLVELYKFLMTNPRKDHHHQTIGDHNSATNDDGYGDDKTKGTGGTIDSTITAAVNEYYDKIVSDWSGKVPDESEQRRQKDLLLKTMDVLEVPTLRIDSDHNILGLYGKDVPGPEVRSVSPVPETKAVLVLRDLSERKERDSSNIVISEQQVGAIGGGVDNNGKNDKKTNKTTAGINNSDSDEDTVSSSTTTSTTTSSSISGNKDRDDAVRNLAERRKERKARTAAAAAAAAEEAKQQ